MRGTCETFWGKRGGVKVKIRNKYKISMIKRDWRRQGEDKKRCRCKHVAFWMEHVHKILAMFFKEIKGKIRTTARSMECLYWSCAASLQKVKRGRGSKGGLLRGKKLKMREMRWGVGEARGNDSWRTFVPLLDVLGDNGWDEGGKINQWNKGSRKRMLVLVYLWNAKDCINRSDEIYRSTTYRYKKVLGIVTFLLEHCPLYFLYFVSTPDWPGKADRRLRKDAVRGVSTSVRTQGTSWMAFPP